MDGRTRTSPTHWRSRKSDRGSTCSWHESSCATNWAQASFGSIQMIDDEVPVDLSALDPTQPPLAFQRRLVAVRAAAEGALRRRRIFTPLAMVAQWRVPLLAALFLLMIVSAALFRSVQGETGIDAVGTDEVADALSNTALLGDGDDAQSTSPADILLGGYEQ